MHHGICPALAGAAPVCIDELGTAPDPAPDSINLPEPDGRPWSALPYFILHGGGPPACG